MSDIICLVAGIFITVLWFNVDLDPKQLDQVKSSCENNKGIKSINVSIDQYRVVCNDTAWFYIKR